MHMCSFNKGELFTYCVPGSTDRVLSKVNSLPWNFSPSSREPATSSHYNIIGSAIEACIASYQAQVKAKAPAWSRLSIAQQEAPGEQWG